LWASREFANRFGARLQPCSCVLQVAGIPSDQAGPHARRRRRDENRVDQTAYRILQEALTNAGRHGTGAARVELAFGQVALELTISNPATSQSSPRPNGGHGLIGMRERATLLGGSLEVERANGSFSVRARLPYAGTSP
jgi:signal transduction histidine kinase